MVERYLRKENESDIEYELRLVDIKKTEKPDDLDWSDIKDLVGYEGNKDSLRKANDSEFGGYAIHKYYQSKEVKQLPKNKIEEITDLIGELDVKKIEVRNKTNQLNKIKRTFVKSIEISNDLKQCLLEGIDNFPEFNYEPIVEYSDNKLIVCLGDQHIGYIINGYKGNYYNYEVAQLRLSKLLAEIEKTCSIYDINTVVVVNLGDTIENAYMRQNQSYECEFDLSNQIVNASKMLFSFITEISKTKNVEVYSLGGNHSRLNSKDANIEGDSANVIINENLKYFVELSKNDRIVINDIDYRDDSVAFKVNGLNIKALHGDNRVGEAKKLFDAECSMDNVDYSLILRGHYHNFNVYSQNNGGYVVTNGCLFGSNPYSVKKMSCNTNATQTLIVVGKEEIECIRDINLQIN